MSNGSSCVTRAATMSQTSTSFKIPLNPVELPTSVASNNLGAFTSGATTGSTSELGSGIKDQRSGLMTSSPSVSKVDAPLTPVLSLLPQRLTSGLLAQT